MPSIPGQYGADPDQAAALPTGAPQTERAGSDRPRRPRGRTITAVALPVVSLAALALVVPGLLMRSGESAEVKTLLVELTAGQCLRGEVAVGPLPEEMVTVPCEQPHHFEVTAVASLPGRELPDDAALERQCAGLRWDYAPDALRLPDDAGYRFIAIDGHMKIVCLMETEGARTESLRQRTDNLSSKQKVYYAATRDLEVLLTLWPDKTVADAAGEHREYARQVSDAIAGTRAALDRHDWGKSMTPEVDKYRIELGRLAALAETVRTSPDPDTMQKAVTDIQDLTFGPANRSLRMTIGLSA